ncbi:hypothetical protein ACLB2K_053145 [Fragaria x ananassa]
MENKGEKTGRRRGPPVVGRKRKFRSLRKILEGTAGRRKWAELQTDCLINVFKRIGMESLVLSVPFVCKSWHEATLDPLCWQNLSFPDFLPLLEPPKSCTSLGALDPFYYKFVDKCRVKNTTTFSITAFVRMVVGRSHGKAVEIKLPGFIDEETLRYVSDSCPGIRVLCLPDDLVLFKHSRVVSELTGKWKLLEQLHLGGNLKQIHTFRADLDKQRMNELFAMGDVWLCETIMDDILKQIGIHCKHFVGLGIAHAYKLNASTIVESLPNLKYLWFEESHLEMKSLHALVKGCKQLEVLDVGKSHVDSIIGGVGVFIADRAKAYGVEFLWQRSGDEDGEDYYSLDAQMLARKLLLNRARGPRMSTGGMAPRWVLAHRRV